MAEVEGKPTCQIGGYGQHGYRRSCSELTEVGKGPEPVNEAAGGATLKEPTNLTQVGAEVVTEDGAAVGHLTADTKAIAHDGLHYDADLLETVPKAVGLTVPKEGVKKVDVASSELHTSAEADAFEEHTGDATGGSNLCCGCTEGTELENGELRTKGPALSLETPGHVIGSCSVIQGCGIPITIPDYHEEALKVTLQQTIEECSGKKQPKRRTQKR